MYSHNLVGKKIFKKILKWKLDQHFNELLIICISIASAVMLFRRSNLTKRHYKVNEKNKT